jgi:sterol desaturase/sphingolipid hydroxylase (fatty acid hydroxylase superfamily)
MEPAELQANIEQIAGFLFLAVIAYLLVELGILHFRGRRLRLREARACGLGVVSIVLASVGVGFLWRTLSVGMFATLGASVSPIRGELGWPWWIYGWIVYEFWYWVQHWAAHKVRLLWCMHSPHHAPGSIHMLVGTNHHMLESVLYMPFFAGFVTALFGVHPVICVALNVVDAIWGSFLHLSSEIVPNGRYGVLERFLQTPSYHRVHHAKNVRYMDTNYNSITLLWDWLLGTLQPLRDDEPVRYGITRESDTGSFWDLHFGEFRLLWRDLVAARSWVERLGYLVMPPGWAPAGGGKTVALAKRGLARAEARGPVLET